MKVNCKQPIMWPLAVAIVLVVASVGCRAYQGPWAGQSYQDLNASQQQGQMQGQTVITPGSPAAFPNPYSDPYTGAYGGSGTR